MFCIERFTATVTSIPRARHAFAWRSAVSIRNSVIGRSRFERSADVLNDLRGMGIRIAIDDFGTGYSSLERLRHLPVDAIKIDRSFVLGMCDDHSDAVIVRSTVDLAHHLGLQVVAEGVETIEVYNTLASLGCDYAQGYFLSKPLDPEKTTTWLEVFGAEIAEEEDELQGWNVEPLAPVGEHQVVFADEPAAAAEG